MKVMCIVEKNSWFRDPPRTTTTTKKYFFGLFTKTETREDDSANGPAYGEICTVLSSYNSRGQKYYILAEWTDGAYNAKGFIPIQDDEVEEGVENKTKIVKR